MKKRTYQNEIKTTKMNELPGNIFILSINIWNSVGPTKENKVPPNLKFAKHDNKCCLSPLKI